MVQKVITWRHAMMYPRWFRLSPRDGTTDREICTNPRVKPPGGTPPALIHDRITTSRRRGRSPRLFEGGLKFAVAAAFQSSHIRDYED